MAARYQSTIRIATTTTTATSSTQVSDIVVTADKVGLLEQRPSTTVFGLSKPLIETPRAGQGRPPAEPLESGNRIDPVVDDAHSQDAAGSKDPGYLRSRGVHLEPMHGI